MNTPTLAQIAGAAHALREARATRRPIGRISERFGIRDAEDAYQVAAINTQERVRAGRRIIGKKVGLTSKSVQRQLGVDQPDFGVLFDDMEFLSGDAVPAGTLIQPKVEAEIAFVVARSLPEGTLPSFAEFVVCLGHALPALEIVDSAIADWKITLPDTVADNASSALFVLGDQPVDIGRLSLAGVAMRMDVDGQEASQGSGAACLGHPLRAAWWLARTMAARSSPLRAGEVILSGALGPMVPIAAGQAIRAELDGLGAVHCTLAGA